VGLSIIYQFFVLMQFICNYSNNVQSKIKIFSFSAFSPFVTVAPVMTFLRRYLRKIITRWLLVRAISSTGNAVFILVAIVTETIFIKRFALPNDLLGRDMRDVVWAAPALQILAPLNPPALAYLQLPTLATGTLITVSCHSPVKPRRISLTFPPTVWVLSTGLVLGVTISTVADLVLAPLALSACSLVLP